MVAKRNALVFGRAYKKKKSIPGGSSASSFNRNSNSYAWKESKKIRVSFYCNKGIRRHNASNDIRWCVRDSEPILIILSTFKLTDK